MSWRDWNVYRYEVANPGVKVRLDWHARVAAVVMGKYAYCFRWKRGKISDGG